MEYSQKVELSMFVLSCALFLGYHVWLFDVSLHPGPLSLCILTSYSIACWNPKTQDDACKVHSNSAMVVQRIIEPFQNYLLQCLSQSGLNDIPLTEILITGVCRSGTGTRHTETKISTFGRRTERPGESEIFCKLHWIQKKYILNH
jgi:hypothetical protein